MLDFDLLVDISRKLHKALGSETQFEKKASELDLLNLFKMKDLKIKKTIKNGKIKVLISTKSYFYI